MLRRKLCPRCKTGKYTYELDPHSAECPYLYCHDGKKCTMYEKLDESGRRPAIFKKLTSVLDKMRKM